MNIVDTRVNREEDPYRLYAVVRTDLDMSAGKIAAQAGHAFLDSFENCRKGDEARAISYKQDHHGIKVTLAIESEEELLELAKVAKANGIFHEVVLDLGYTQFEGQPTVTALGIGPIRKGEFPELQKYNTMR